MVAADAFRALAVLAIVGYPGEAPLWLLAGLVFLVGGGEAFFRPAYGALIPAILPDERRAAANAMTSVSLRSGAIVGPALGAALVAVSSVRVALLVDALTFAVSLEFSRPRRWSSPVRVSVGEQAARPALGRVHSSVRWKF